jgi:hypothetical protein
MSSLRIRALVALLAASLLVPAAVAPAAGYVSQRDIRLSLSGPSRVRCDQKAVITATVWNIKKNKPVRNQAIRWRVSVKASAADRLNRYKTFTRSNGTTSTKLIFGPKAGKRVVRAVMPGFKKSSIVVRCRGGLN